MESPGRWVSPAKQLSAPRRAQSFSRGAGWMLDGPGRWVRQALGGKPPPVELAEPQLAEPQLAEPQLVAEPQLSGRQAPVELGEEQPDLGAGTEAARGERQAPEEPEEDGGATPKPGGEMQGEVQVLEEEAVLPLDRLSSVSSGGRGEEDSRRQGEELAPQPELATLQHGKLALLELEGLELAPQPEPSPQAELSPQHLQWLREAREAVVAKAEAEAEEAEAAEVKVVVKEAMEAMAARVVAGAAAESAAAAAAESAAAVAKAEAAAMNRAEAAWAAAAAAEAAASAMTKAVVEAAVVEATTVVELAPQAELPPQDDECVKEFVQQVS